MAGDHLSGSPAHRLPRSHHRQRRSRRGAAAAWPMLDVFREIWCVDFEYGAGPGCRPSPVCLVTCEIRTGRTLRLWRDQLGPMPPWTIGDDSLFVAFYASAE